MKTVNLHQAKTHLSSLIRDLREGRESAILISITGAHAVAKIVPIDGPPRRELGVDRGLIKDGTRLR